MISALLASIVLFDDPGVRGAIGTLCLAGIKVTMITGWFSDTLLFHLP